MAHLLDVFWIICQFIAAYSWDRENFPATLCISWQNSDDCQGGIAALSSNGVRLNTAIYFGEDINGNLSRISITQWIEINPGETAAVTYHGNTQFASVFHSGNQTSKKIFSQLISLPNPSVNSVREEYIIEQLEHGGAVCNCLMVYFGATCTSEDTASTRFGICLC